MSAYLALLQVLLLARLPGIEQLAGFDRLTVWHRWNGRACIMLVLAHVVLITVGYAALDRLSLPSEIDALFSSYPGMITATVGTALFLAVIGTSLVIVRRRLRYEAWYAVHVLAVAAIALAWFHQVPTGTETRLRPRRCGVLERPLRRDARARRRLPRAQADRGRARYRMRIAEVTAEPAEVVSIRITGRDLGRLRARPGQFFLRRFLSRSGNAWEAHPFSLSEAPDGSSLRITVKGSGHFTQRTQGFPSV